MAMISSLSEQATRARCLEGTARAIMRKGIAATTVQDILAAAGLSRRTFYLHFHSKEDALRALFEILTDATLEAIRAATTADDPVDRALQAADKYLALWQADAKLSLLLQTEAMRTGSALAPARRRLLDALCSDGVTNYERATGHRIDPLIFRALALCLEGLLSHLHEASDVTYARIRAVFESIARSTLTVERDPPRPDPKGRDS